MSSNFDPILIALLHFDGFDLHSNARREPSSLILFLLMVGFIGSGDPVLAPYHPMHLGSDRGHRGFGGRRSVVLASLIWFYLDRRSCCFRMS